MIHVTKPYLPNKDKYVGYVSSIWEKVHLTNHGPLAQKLEQIIPQVIGSPSMCYVTNGTIALQLAIQALDLKGEILTTPYSYVATTSAILWEKCKPVFVDVLSNGNINPNLIEEQITDKTSAILATHVYGVPCEIDRIQRVAEKYGLKVIYDAAHAFGVTFRGKSIFQFGDASTASFHATKLFHTVEGGAVFSRSREVLEKTALMRAFGHIGDEHFCLGINGKQSEFHAAMGLCVLPEVESLINERKGIFEIYLKELSDVFEFVNQDLPLDVEYNYAYVPIRVPHFCVIEKFVLLCHQKGVGIRRYFYPSLNKLPYISDNRIMPVSESLANSVVCIPIFNKMKSQEVDLVINTLKQCLEMVQSQ
jgi:dTDP-4-amino-4,6-dideoxygalactose transaminase